MIDYEKALNSAVTDIKPSGIRKFFDLAEQMKDVISLGVGEPDFRTAWKIRSEAIHYLERGNTRYTSNKGLKLLRAEISSYTERKYGVSYDPETQIIVTVGGSEGIDLALRSLINPGDEVIIPQPSYVCYEPITRLCGGKPVILNTKPENDFKVTKDELRELISERTKVLILPYPSNPTGAIMTERDLTEVAEALKDTNIMVISDEIYSELTFGTSHTPTAKISGLYERTLTVNGFSKAFAMTGWRLGYVMGPEPLIRQMLKIHQYAIMCAPTNAQMAAAVALRSCDIEVAKMKEEYDDRRKIIVSGFNELGLECREPKGAFYAFPSIKSTKMSSEEFCERLLRSKSVALVPGTAFGESGEGFVRASYCYSISHIKEALRRIKEFLQEL